MILLTAPIQHSIRTALKRGTGAVEIENKKIVNNIKVKLGTKSLKWIFCTKIWIWVAINFTQHLMLQNEKFVNSYMCILVPSGTP